MSFIKRTIIPNYKRFWTQAFNVKSDATRTEFWIGHIINGLVLSLTTSSIIMMLGEESESLVSDILVSLLTLTFLIPSITQSIRRLHHAHLKWWLAIPLIWYTITDLIPLHIFDLNAYFDDASDTMKSYISIYIYTMIMYYVVYIICMLRKGKD